VKTWNICLFDLGIVAQHGNLHFHSFCSKLHNFILCYGWIILYGTNTFFKIRNVASPILHGGATSRILCCH
jgi:hypothetical protein